MSKSEEKRIILNMLKDGKISVDESIRLLESLEEESTDFKKEWDNFLVFVKDTASKLGQKGQELLRRVEKNMDNKKDPEESINQSRMEILKMVEEGKITSQEAIDLLGKIGG